MCVPYLTGERMSGLGLMGTDFYRVDKHQRHAIAVVAVSAPHREAAIGIAHIVLREAGHIGVNQMGSVEVVGVLARVVKNVLWRSTLPKACCSPSCARRMWKPLKMPT